MIGAEHMLLRVLALVVAFGGISGSPGVCIGGVNLVEHLSPFRATSCSDQKAAEDSRSPRRFAASDARRTPHDLGSWEVIPDAAGGTQAFVAAQRAVNEAFPRDYRATHRAIITVRKRQFVCDGFLEASPADGLHLALISTLGLVTEVRVRGDGSSEVVKITPLFREEWARDYVAPELRWLFFPPGELTLAGRLNDGRMVLESADQTNGLRVRYACRADGSRWEELEVVKGKRRLFHARLSSFRLLDGWARSVPREIELEAGAHQLHLQIAAMSVTGAEPRGGEK